MGVYLHLFDTDEQFEQKYHSDSYVEPWLSYTEENTEVTYNKTEEERLRGTPFTMVALGTGTFSWKLANYTKIQYSKNGGDWTLMTNQTQIPVVANDEVRFKGSITNYSGRSIASTTAFNVEGNIMSLSYSGNFETTTTLTNMGQFGRLFSGSPVVSAEKLLLPATTMLASAYTLMFANCANLVSAPELPAMTTAARCYEGMFSGCTNLVSGSSVLPASGYVASSCYMCMYDGCTNLVTAPVILARKFGFSSCYYMFRNCSKLSYIKCMATETDTYGTLSWVNGVNGVSLTGTFVKNAAAPSNFWTIGNNDGIPEGWTVETAEE